MVFTSKNMICRSIIRLFFDLRFGTPSRGHFGRHKRRSMLKRWICGALSDFPGSQNPLWVRGRTQQSASARFSPLAVSQSCTAPYLTSPFFMLSHWVSVSAGNPAIAVARKVGVLGAPEIENGSPFSFQFFFSIFLKIMKKHEKCLFFNTFQGF